MLQGGKLPKAAIAHLQAMSLSYPAPKQRLISYGSMRFEVPDHQRLVQDMKRMGLSPDKNGAVFFNVSASSSGAYLKIHVAERLEIELFTAGPQLLDPKTVTAALKVLRELRQVLGNRADEWASWILQRRIS